MHVNLFKNGHSRQEIKEALKSHQKRDNNILKVIDVVFGFCVLFLVRSFSGWDAVAIVLAIYTGLTGIRYFIDQSMRNFYLHRLDWEESKFDEINN